jgi:hypothetical protein
VPTSPLRLAGKLALGAVIAVLGLCPSAGSAEAKGSPYLLVPEAAVAEATSAYRYANMSNDEAFTELDRRKIIYTREMSTAGVRAPIRLTGRLHGVYFHSSLPPDERVQSPFEILDARLALALDDFAAVLERHDIVEVMHFTMYRPNVAAHDHGVLDEPVSSPRASRNGKGSARAKPDKMELDRKARPAPRARSPKQKLPTGATAQRGQKSAPKGRGTGKPAAKPVAKPKPMTPAQKTTFAPPGTRHPAGLAIDVGGLRKRDGRWLSVGIHFAGKIGDKTCGEGAQVPESPEARELRSIVCESADLGIFTYVLTPNYNAAHVDHYHMEIKPGVRWFLYH